jgi:hypothetical protein
MAVHAAAEMNADLPGGAGTNVTALINSFSTTNNYLPANLGQLKSVAQPFYDRLIAVGYTNAYPWASATTTNDFAIANIGQLKNLFAWDLTYSSVGDGIPNWWRALYFANQPTGNQNGTMTNSQSCAACDADGTGQNNMFKYVTGLNPTNTASVFLLNITPTNQPSQNNLLFTPLALGRTYTPEFSTDLTSGVWLPLSTYLGPLTNNNRTQASVIDTNPIPPREFYRIQISLP